MSRRFEIGTIAEGNFQTDTIGNDPECTTFDTLEDAIREIEDVIAHAVEIWGEPLTNGAIKDAETRQIVWRQRTEAPILGSLTGGAMMSYRWYRWEGQQ